jgi:hypothetical protein
LSVVDDVRERVQRLLCDWRGSVTQEDDHFVVDQGTARAVITVEPCGDTHAAVRVDAVTNWGLDPSLELYQYVATQAGTPLVFGALRTVERDDAKCNVVVSYGFLGDTVDPDELVNAVSVVVATAEDLGAQIKARFGGALTWDN